MKLKLKHKLKPTVLTLSFFAVIWMILVSGIYTLPDNDLLPGMGTASAGTNYGIHGQPAPELNLDGWIDGNGKKMDPIRLSDYRGKVVYLYFFQDW